MGYRLLRAGVTPLGLLTDVGIVLRNGSIVLRGVGPVVLRDVRAVVVAGGVGAVIRRLVVGLISGVVGLRLLLVVDPDPIPTVERVVVGGSDVMRTGRTRATPVSPLPPSGS